MQEDELPFPHWFSSVATFLDMEIRDMVLAKIGITFLSKEWQAWNISANL
jgi:hypothetical protein